MVKVQLIVQVIILLLSFKVASYKNLSWQRKNRRELYQHKQFGEVKGYLYTENAKQLKFTIVCPVKRAGTRWDFNI